MSANSFHYVTLKTHTPVYKVHIPERTDCHQIKPGKDQI